MIEIFTSCAGQGRSFVLVNKVLEDISKEYLFITLELNENEIFKRLKNSNRIKDNHRIEDIKCTIKEFPTRTPIKELVKFIQKVEENYDSILIDQSYLIQNSEIDKELSYTENMIMITDIYVSLADTIQKPISLTYNLGISYLTDSYDKLYEARKQLLKGLKKVDRFIKGEFIISNVYKRDNIIYKLTYPYNKFEEVINMDTYLKEWKKTKNEEIFG